MKLTESQEDTVNILAVNFLSKPKVKKEIKGIKVSLLEDSRIENFKCVKFIHVFYIDKNGGIYDKQVKIKKVKS